MERESPPTRVWNGQATNLLLFTDEPAAPAEASPLTHAPATPEGSLARKPPLALAQITTEWQRLLKRLGRRRRVLETILTAGRPVQLTDDTLVIGFPPDRRFHRELLDMPEYRGCVEEGFARMFGVRLSVVPALYPESRGLPRRGAFGKSPA
jgi:hypothetical protein